jgi:hypothetical protein
MTLTRLLATTLLLGSLPAFSQTAPVGRNSGSVYSHPAWASTFTGPIIPGKLFLFPGEYYFSQAATPSEPWRLIPAKPSELGSGLNILDPTHLDRYRLDARSVDPSVRMFQVKNHSATSTPTVDSPRDGDVFCLKIRSYVVARDSKNSDSTHPVSYSTCQPSSRYGLKTTEIRTQSIDR